VLDPTRRLLRRAATRKITAAVKAIAAPHHGQLEFDGSDGPR